jgi:type I restriction enzyme S subunit
VEGFTNAAKEIGYQGVRVDDLVVHAMDGFAGAIGVSDSEGKCSPVYSVCVPKRRGQIDVAYYGYLVRQLAVTDYITSLAKGIRERSTEFRFSEFAVLPLAVPPKEEQTQIAKFLDYETAKIDALIEKQQQLIALLKEKRQAVISHAVTKGLNPDAPMRDSGVEWLGEVPAHWITCPLMHIVDPNRQVMYGIVLPGPNVDDGVPIVKGGDVKPGRLTLASLNRTTFEIEKKYVRSRLKKNDLVYAIRGGVGDIELVPAEIEGANLTQDAARIAPANGILPRWLLMSLRGEYFWRQIERRIVGATVRGINIRDLKRGIVAVPPKEEQIAISDFLERRLAKLDRLQANLEAFLSGLTERRTALISAAVTGKIDVRGWTPPESAAEAEVA